MTQRRSKRYMRNTRNRSQLHGALSSKGLEVWRHFFWAKPLDSEIMQPFLLEYLLLNPSHKERKKQPYFHASGSSFAAVRLLRIGAESRCVAEFFGMQDVELSKHILSLRFGRNICLEDALTGQLVVMEKDWGVRFGLTDTGSVKWDLQATKTQSYGYGFMASRLVTAYNLIGLSWHVGGLKATFDGYLAFDDDEYNVSHATSYGFQDKIWGAYLGDEWMKLYAGRLLSADGLEQKSDALTIFRHRKTIWGQPQGYVYHIIYTHEGILYDFSSDSKKTLYTVQETLQEDSSIQVLIEAITATERLVINVIVLTEHTCNVQYPHPQGGNLSLKITAPVAGTLELSSLVPLVGWQVQVQQRLELAVYESSSSLS
jgi:tocopherol cyclase